MPRFYMHLRDSTDEVIDPDGVDLPDLAAVRKTVMTAARDLIAGDVRDGTIDLRYRIDAEDESGAIVHSLALKDAFTIIAPD